METGLLQTLEAGLDPALRGRLDEAAGRIVEAKARGGKIIVITGSGPNLHEGVTTLIAELMRVGLVDGVTTSAAVVAHEMAGTLDEVKRVDGGALGLPASWLPRGGEFELTRLDPQVRDAIARELPLDEDLLARLEAADGKTIIKAAGNLGYPMGLWIERLAPELRDLARARGLSFERVAGLGADPRTMIGQGAEKGLPVLATIPQLVGGGAVGLCIGDSLPLAERAERLARMLADADVLIESGVALTQEIHDGPFETYTGHGLWAAWQGAFTFSLQEKALIRIDLDPALETVWRIERTEGQVQAAIAEGMPKTKAFQVPFRMEMSGFARLEGSLPLIGDLGVLWPLLATRAAAALGIELSFLSYPQQSDAGRRMREGIVRDIRPFSRARLEEGLARYGSARAISSSS